MAKKRRKPQSRSRNRPTGAATRTADRPQPSGPSDVSSDGGSEPAGAERTEPKADPRTKRPASPSHRAATAPLRTRAEKKELARAEREAVRRQIARAQRRRQLVWIAGIAIAVAAGVFFYTNRNDTSSPDALPGELTTEAPWPANGAKSAARATALGLPPEGTTMHEHTDVQIFVHGKKERIPTDIGINASAGTIQSIHTHDDTGLVHLESSESREFTLGDFFGVWGVRFTPTCLGAYCNEGDNRLQVFLDGEEVTDDLQDVQLDDQTVIVITYGTPAELPDPIPSSFDFSSINP
jgi:hypothetical protein